MYSKISLTFSLTILLASASIAQKNILPSYIITLEGDTISGQMDYRVWQQNPSSIVFMKDGAETRYTANEIAGFSVADQYYKGAIVETNISSRDANTLESNSKPRIRIDTTFLRVVMLGEKSLYMATNSLNIQNFYIESDKMLSLLEYKKYILYTESNELGNGGERVASNQKYIGQLTFLLGDCEGFGKTLKSLSYTESSLRNVFSKYYECTGYSATLTTRHDKLKGRIGVLGGIFSTGVNFDKTEDQNLILVNYQKPTSPAFGITYVMEKENGKWSLSNNLIYSSFIIQGTSTTESGVFVRMNTISYGMKQLRLITMPRYDLLKFNQTKLFISGGASFSLTMGSTNELSYSSNFANSGSRLALNAINKTEFGFLGGLGVKRNKLSFETRYESVNGSANFAKTNHQYFLIGYSF